MPKVFCEVAFTRDTAGYPLWQDVSEYVEWAKGVSVIRRRSHELDEVQPGTLSLTLLNNDGRFTAGRQSSPYYPNVKINRPIRIRARWPGSVNMLLKGQAEGSDTSLFSVGVGSLATSPTAPTGQTSSIRWAATVAVGDIMRLGVNSTTTPTDEALSVVGGASYSVHCQARREAVAVSVAIRVRWFDSSGAVITDVFSPVVALSTSFQPVAFSGVAPANAAFVRVLLRAETAATGVAVLTSAWQLERAAAPTAWVTPGNEYRRITAFVDRWPHAWAGGVLGTAEITATDRQKLLGRGKVRAAVAQETLFTKPLCYYPLGEPQEAEQGGNIAGTPQPDMLIGKTGNGGTATFGAKGGPDESTGVQLSPADTNNGRHLVAPVLTTPLGGTAAISLGLWVNFGLTPHTGQNRLIYVDNGNDTIHLRLNYEPSSNTLNAGARLPIGAAASSSSAFNLDDNQLHFVVLVGEFVAGTLQLRAYVDGVQAFNTTTTLSGSTWPTLNRIRVGGLPGSTIDPPEMMHGNVSHVACWNLALSQTQAQAISSARTGFPGELSGARATRLATWAGITRLAIDAGASLMARHPAAEQSPLAALKQVAESEAGLFFMSGDDQAVFHGRVRRQLAAPVSITLAAHECGPDLQFTMDDQLLINDVAVSRLGRTVTRVLDQESVDDHGSYTANIDTLLNSDTEAIDRAAYTVSTYGHPQPRAGQITVDAHSLGTKWEQLLGSEIGQRIEVTDLPDDAPSTSVELWCEGVEDTITDSTWTIRFDTSPVRNTPVFILDNPIHGTLDNNYLGW
ncbi:LamG-like jellyroll fold domain-containing protein [Nonomuraea dietziae]|uniref:LamG-like jellyroll fold domain-containing protein n=1 Tax=Nonomuraea dietziae TaxID=65515 RepID=UPI003446CD47